MIYNDEKQIESCEFPNHKIGVYVTQPFRNYDGIVHVDIEYSTPELDRSTFGRATPIDEAESKVIECEIRIVARIDALIAELQEHRARILENIDRIAANGIDGLPRCEKTKQLELFD